MPNAVGISSSGIGPNNNAYQYFTNSFQGTAKINSLSTNTSPIGISQGDHTVGLQLNVNLVFTSNGYHYVYWVQDIARIDTSSGEITFLNNVWNCTIPSSTIMTSSGITGKGQVISSSQGQFYTYSASGSGANINLQFPTTVTLSVSCAQSASGEPTISFAFQDGYGLVTYDIATLTTNSAISNNGFLVDGSQYKPIGKAYDAELLLVGPGGAELSTNLIQSDVKLQLDYWNGHNYQTVTNAFNYGIDAAETISNAQSQEYTSGNGELLLSLQYGNEVPGKSYDSSTVGILDVKSSLTSGILSVTNVANPAAGTWQITFNSGEVTVTVAPGSYVLQLFNSGVLYCKLTSNVIAGQIVSLQAPFANPPTIELGSPSVSGLSGRRQRNYASRRIFSFNPINHMDVWGLGLHK